MPSRPLLLVLLPALALLGACSSSAERPEVRMADVGLATAEPSAAPAEPAWNDVKTPVENRRPRVDEEAIRQALAESQQGRLPDRPARLIALEVTPAAGGASARPLPAHELEALRTVLVEKGRRVSTVETIPTLFLPEPIDLNGLRYQAARLGGDVLVLVTRGTNTYRRANGWAWLYPTIVGLFVAPGRSFEVWTAAEAALVDVPTGRPLAVVAADAREDVAVGLFADDGLTRRELQETSDALLLTRLGAAIEERLR